MWKGNLYSCKNALCLLFGLYEMIFPRMFVEAVSTSVTSRTAPFAVREFLCHACGQRLDRAATL